MREINRPSGSLGRSQACNLAMRLWGDQLVTDEVVKTWLDRLVVRNGWLDMGRKRPIPHESWCQVAGYFFYYGHYYAALCIELLPATEPQALPGPFGTGADPPARERRLVVGFPAVRLPPAVRHRLCADVAAALSAHGGGSSRVAIYLVTGLCPVAHRPQDSAGRAGKPVRSQAEPGNKDDCEDDGAATPIPPGSRVC